MRFLSKIPPSPHLSFVLLSDALYFFFYHKNVFLTTCVLSVMQVDVGKDGTLDYGKFAALTVHLQRMDNDEHLHKAFLHFDLDGNGFIDFEELKQALMDEMAPDDTELIKDIMTEVDTDKVSTQYSHSHKFLPLLHSMYRKMLYIGKNQSVSYTFI